jgi:hypothetical protein
MHTSEAVPERDYRVKGIEYQGVVQGKVDDGDPKGANEYLKIEVLDEPVKFANSPNCGERPDKEVVGRRARIFLGNELKGYNFGFRDVSMALQLDGDADIDGEDLVGIPFDVTLFYKVDKKDPEKTYLNAKPCIDYDWVNKEEAKDGKKGKAPSKPNRKATKAQASEARRSARRSG